MFAPTDFFSEMDMTSLDCYDYPVTTFGINLSIESQKVVHERVEEYLTKLKEGLIPEQQQNKLS